MDIEGRSLTRTAGIDRRNQAIAMLQTWATQTGRTVQVLRVAGAGADHPYLAHVPEGRYLKAVFCRVE